MSKWRNNYTTFILILVVVFGVISVPTVAATGTVSNESEVTNSSIPEKRTPVSASFGQDEPWYIQQINAHQAVRYAEQNARQKTVQVAVIGNGVDYEHPDLKNQVVWGANTTPINSGGSFTYGVKTTMDESGHDTAVAGVVGAADNNRGVVGVAPNIELYAIKTLNPGEATYGSWPKGFRVAIKGPDKTLGTPDDPEVIVTSWAFSRNGWQEFRTSIRKAANHSVVVTAGGNSGDGDPNTSEVYFPGNAPEVIAVGATNRSTQVPAWAGEGGPLDVSAPAADIKTTELNGYQRKSGTSFSAPQVAGVVAQMALVTGNSSDEILLDGGATDILKQTAKDIGPPGEDNFSGAGEVRALAAVKEAESRIEHHQPPPPVIGSLQPTDPDGDTRFEDLSGDGSVDLIDVQLLYNNRNDPVVTDNTRKYDYTGDGTVSLLDVQALYVEVTGS